MSVQTQSIQSAHDELILCRYQQENPWGLATSIDLYDSNGSSIRSVEKIRAFERFWQATANNRQLECRTFAAALRYLRASVHGAILDTLRTYQRLGEVSRPASRAPGEPSVEDVTCSSELWDILKGILPNPRELHLACLLFQGGLGPRDIAQVWPQEWSCVHEIYRLRHTIMEREVHNVDSLRWRLN